MLAISFIVRMHKAKTPSSSRVYPIKQQPTHNTSHISQRQQCCNVCSSKYKCTGTPEVQRLHLRTGGRENGLPALTGSLTILTGSLTSRQKHLITIVWKQQGKMKTKQNIKLSVWRPDVTCSFLQSHELELEKVTLF